MAEENKKVTKKSPTTKTTNSKKKTTNTKKATSKKTTSTKKTNSTKKTTPKKTTAKKTNTPVKELKQPKKIEKVKIEEIELEPIDQVVEKEEVEEIISLDKTLIIDGEDNENLKEVVNNLEKDRILTKDKVIVRSKTRKKIILVLLGLIIASIIFATIFIIKEEVVNKQTVNSDIMSKVSRNEGKEFESEPVDDTDEYERLKMINVAQFEEKVKKQEDMYIIITEATCLFCLEYEPIVEEVLQEQNKEIYELDIFYLNQEEIERFRQYYAFDTMPTIFYLKDGIVSSDLIGPKTKEELTTWITNNN